MTASAFASEPRGDAYDLVVIGSGLGGLSAAAFAARAGLKVLLAERQDAPGGYAHAFRRGDYVFDPAIHGTSFGRMEPTVPTLLELLGVGDRCTFIPYHDPLYTVFFPGLRLDAPIGVDNFLEAHLELFPEERAGLTALVGRMLELTRERERPRPQSSLRQLEAAAEAFPLLLEYRTSTVADVVDGFINEPRLKTLVTATWPNLALPPSQLAFPLWAAMTSARIETGQWYCAGSFQRLVDAFVAAIDAFGGEIVVGNEVTRIVVDAGRVTGAELASGLTVRAPAVISNADATHTFETLVGAENLPAPFLSRLRRMRPSVSAFLVYAATTLDVERFGLGHVSFIFKSWDHDDTYSRMLAGEPTCLAISIPTLSDPSLAPPNEHILACTALLPFDVGGPWAEVKDRYTDLLLAEMEAVLPGVREQLTFIEGATPAALEHYSGNHRGALYGWENSPQQADGKRLKNSAPIGGLFLAGHWTQPGTGSLATIFSGVRAASLVVGRPLVDAAAFGSAST